MKIVKFTLLVIAFLLYSISASALTKENEKIINSYQDTMSLEWVKTISKKYEYKEIYLHKVGFTLSYNCLTNNPNWVSWRINSKNYKTIKGRPDYTPDFKLPKENQVTPSDYVGYSRGLMCPASDMKLAGNKRALIDCYKMSNICPQELSLDGGEWYTLEYSCRNWALQSDEFYVIAGPIFNDISKVRIIKGKEREIYIPDGFFKVILAFRYGKMISTGFMFKNESMGNYMDLCDKSVDEIEETTGFDFFSVLPDSIENKIESQNISYESLCNLFGGNNFDPNRTVYIYTDSKGKTFHSRKDCSSLKSVPFDEIKNISVLEAKDLGREPCYLCYEPIKSIPSKKKDHKALFWIVLTAAIVFFLMYAGYVYKTKFRGSMIKDSYSKLSSLITEVADTKIICTFLQQFAKKDALKYTTHNWDENTDTKQKQYDNYDAFREQYCVILSQWKDSVSAKCPLLWNLISNFMLEEEGGQEWSEHNIKVGYNKFLKKWMDEHPEEQPKDMPLSEFPQDIRPGIINKRSVSCFGDIIEVFKNCIEFRDDELYSMVRSVFKSAKLKFDTDNLECLKGRNFYTDTELVEKAVRIIAANIAQHGETSEVFVEYKYEKFEKMNKMQISILHIGSFSNKDIKDRKITAENKDGAMATIKDLLRNLCDFAVESKFRVKDKILPLHISYLISDTNESGIYQIPDEECEGFKYILTFYTDFK